jgi:HAD superfamily hydrolase (TIGR01549 family)
VLSDRSHWVFDLDGTLTVPVHDFAAIRAMLGLPEGVGILEALHAMPPEQSAPLVRKLDEFEYELACNAVVAAGAHELLAELARRGVRLGIVTQNNARNVFATLEATGLTPFFPVDAFMTREHASPKPSPEGIRTLLAQWNADAETSVMVGNHLIDLLAGRAAGTSTVLVAERHEPAWHEHADLVVVSLSELRALL